jgi:hypothetical protein
MNQSTLELIMVDKDERLDLIKEFPEVFNDALGELIESAPKLIEAMEISNRRMTGAQSDTFVGGSRTLLFALELLIRRVFDDKETPREAHNVRHLQTSKRTSQQDEAAQQRQPVEA